MISRIRSVGDKIFPQYPAANFRRKFDRSGVKEFNQMLKVNPASATYTQFPPILYKGGDPAVETPFTHDCLLKVRHYVKLHSDILLCKQIAKIMLFGATALDDSDGKQVGPTPSGIKWGLDGVTPGLIAFTGILVSHFLSVAPRSLLSKSRHDSCYPLIPTLGQKVQIQTSTTRRISTSIKEFSPL